MTEKLLTKERVTNEGHMEQWSEILKAVAGSPYGLVALFLLIAGLVLVPYTPRPQRFVVVLLVLVVGAGLVVVGIYRVEPDRLVTERTEAQNPAQAAPPSPTNAAPPQPSKPVAAPNATPSPAPRQSPPPARIDCGTAWTGWIGVGGGVGNPCPSNCTRGAELGQSYRSVGFPPRPQTKHKFQCWKR